jgi:outer membrane protein
MKTNLLVVVVFIFSLTCRHDAFAQNTMAFSLKQAQDYAFQNNFDLRNSANDVLIAEKEVKKNTAIGLPQISAGIDYMDNFMLPTSLIPNFLSFLDTTGNAPKYLEVKFGTQYNLSVDLQATQLVYSGQYLVGLQTAKAYLASVKQKMVRDQMDVKDLVTQAYISYLVVQEAAKILDSTYTVMTKLVDETRIAYKTGLIEDIEVDQLELNKSNLEASMTSINSQTKIAYSYLKFVMGIPQGQEITLTDDIDFFLNSLHRDYLIKQGFDINYNIDYSVLKKQEYLVSMQVKLAKSAYQPSLLAFIGVNTSGYRDTWDFFNEKGLWYTSSNWGLSLAIPIWSSGQRKYQVDQAKLQYEKIKVVEEKTKVGMNLQVETLRNDFENSYNVFMNNKKSVETARKIYDKTIVKYRLGVATSTDLNQRYNQFLQNESNYIQSILVLISNQIKLSKMLERV